MADVKRQTFNPDHVMMHELKDGTVPKSFNQVILKDFLDSSKVIALGQYEEMDNLEKEFQFFTKGPGAYWVGEGQKIKTSRPQLANATLRARKLGVILPVSREYLNYTQSDFFNIMAPQVAEAFYKKFDNAFILDVDNPFAQSIKGSAEKAGNIVDGELTYDNILDLEDKITDAGYDVNGFISSSKNKSVLRKQGVKTENGVALSIYDRQADEIDNIATETLRTNEMTRGTLVAGDFDYLRYGIPYPISYKIDESAQLSTITNADGTPINLFEQELIACRFTMDIGAMVLSDDAFAMIKGEPVEEGTAETENLETV